MHIHYARPREAHEKRGREDLRDEFAARRVVARVVPKSPAAIILTRDGIVTRVKVTEKKGDAKTDVVEKSEVVEKKEDAKKIFVKRVVEKSELVEKGGAKNIFVKKEVVGKSERDAKEISAKSELVETGDAKEIFVKSELSEKGDAKKIFAKDEVVEKGDAKKIYLREAMESFVNKADMGSFVNKAAMGSFVNKAMKLEPKDSDSEPSGKFFGVAEVGLPGRPTEARIGLMVTKKISPHPLSRE